MRVIVASGGGARDIQRCPAISPVVVAGNDDVPQSAGQIGEAGIVWRGAFGHVNIAGHEIVLQLLECGLGRLVQRVVLNQAESRLSKAQVEDVVDDGVETTAVDLKDIGHGGGLRLDDILRHRYSRGIVIEIDANSMF